MKRFVIGAIAALSLAAQADIQWPVGGGTVRLNNRVVSTNWRDGKPWVQRAEIYHLLGIPAEGEPELELGASLGAPGRCSAHRHPSALAHGRQITDTDPSPTWMGLRIHFRPAARR